MSSPDRRNKIIALISVATVALMVGASYASVPLYKVFCQATGYDGTTQRAEAAPTEILDRDVTVTFNADVSPDLAWKFQPVQRNVTVKVGETALIYYRATNMSAKPIVGMATFNVTPDKAGQYFDKIACFCFTEQRLAPGQSVDMPVTFFIDPAIAKDRNLDELTDVTLSYTFFPVEKPATSDTASVPSPATTRIN